MEGRRDCLVWNIRLKSNEKQICKSDLILLYEQNIEAVLIASHVREGWKKMDHNQNDDINEILKEYQRQEKPHSHSNDSGRDYTGGNQRGGIDPHSDWGNGQRGPGNYYPGGKKKRKKPIWIAGILAGIAAIAFALFLVNGQGIIPGKKAKWSVFIYFCGSNLESDKGYASSQIEEMLPADLNDVNVIIETGGADQWQDSQIDPSLHQRFEISDHTLKEVGSEKKRSMGDADTLADFLKWGVRKYPAKKYAAVLWDHGGGSLYGICKDDQFSDDNSIDTLSLPELETAFRKSGAEFETVLMDACLMASLETAEAVQPYVKYLVASEDSEPGGACFYRSWLEELNADPDMSGRQLGKNMVDSYYDACVSLSENNKVQDLRTAMLGTMSEIDLSRVPDILNAFSSINDVMEESVNDPETFGQIVRGANQAKYFSSLEAGMVDMYDLVEKISPAVQKASPDDIYKAIEEAVVYQKNGLICDDVHGISVFYPLKDSSTSSKLTQQQIEIYSQISKNQPYIDFMYSTDYANWTDDYHGNTDIDYPDQELPWSYSEELHSSGQLELVIQNMKYLESVYDVMTTQMETEDGEEVTVNFGQMINKNIDISSSDDSGTFISNFDGTWLEINGTFVTVIIVENNENEHYIRMLIPALIDGEEGEIDAVYLTDSDEYQILGWHIVTEEGISERAESIPEGAALQFIYGNGSSEDSYLVSEESIYHENSTVLDHDYTLEEGSYNYQFYMTDIYGNEVRSNGATFTVRANGTLGSKLNS